MEDLTQVITDSISGLEGSESESAASETSSVDGTEQTAPAETTQDEPTAKPQSAMSGLEEPVKPSRALRRGPIPYDRHEQALTQAREQAKAETLAQHQAQLQAVQQRAQLLDIADREPERFLQALVAVDPRYGDIVRKIAGGNGHGNGHQAAPAEQQEQMPQPDARFADGSIGYSPEQLQKLFDWRDQQVEKRVTERYKPIEEAWQVDQQIRGATQRVHAQLQDAMQWDGFAQAQPEIAAALKANPRLSLEGAYRAVVLPKLRAGRDAMRAEILAELNQKPKGVSKTSPGGMAPPKASSDDLESIIRASIANLPR